MDTLRPLEVTQYTRALYYGGPNCANHILWHQINRQISVANTVIVEKSKSNCSSTQWPIVIINTATDSYVVLVKHTTPDSDSHEERVPHPLIIYYYLSKM